MFVGIEQNNVGTANNVRSFANQFAWQFPVVRDDRESSAIFRAYESERDNYIIVDREGKIAYRAATGFASLGWFSYGPGVIQALANLGITPVERLTWGRIKSLY